MKNVLIVFCIVMFLSCAHPKTVVIKSIPQSELNRYKDSFNTLNEDLWEIYAESSDWQMENFQFADITVDGILKIKTKKDTYSKGNLHSKFMLRGDYDVQVDCGAVFKKVSGDMTYNLFFETATIREHPTDPLSVAFIEITKNPNNRTGTLSSAICAGVENEDCSAFRNRKVSSFIGSLRIVRNGDQVRTMFKEKDDLKWKPLGRFSYHCKDQYVGLALSNSFLKRKKIDAPVSIEGFFDNFVINAAEEVVESDI